MSEFWTIAKNQAPYDVLSAREALVEAAKLNRMLLEEFAETPTSILEFYARASLSLSTYALALDRWSP